MPDLGLLRGGARAKLAGDTRFSKRARTHMANNPKKVKDPTEVALSAIQEALNIEAPSDDAGRDSTNGDNNNKDVTNSSSRAFPEPGFDFGPRADVGPTRPERTAVFDAIEQPPIARRAANDDRET